MRGFFEEEAIEETLKGEYSPSRVKAIFDEHLTKDTLTPSDIAQLLSIQDEGALSLLLARAREAKERLFGNKIYLFAPLYLSNECANGCLYCGFRNENSLLARRTLSVAEAVEEAKFLSKEGHREILLVSAENPSRVSVEYLCDVVDSILDSTGIESVNVNCAPLSAELFRELRKSRASLYQSFQETYHKKTYEAVHASGKKSDYWSRVETLERACEGGFLNLGFGFLMGLYDHKFETLALIQHIRYINDVFAPSSVTISLPRLRPAIGAQIQEPLAPVSDFELKKVLGILRLVFPESRITISTRESREMRLGLCNMGITTLSAGSRTSPGGYSKAQIEEEGSQFSIDDQRTLSEVSSELATAGYLPVTGEYEKASAL